MVPLFCVVIAGLCGLVVPAPAPEETEFYTTKYDHVDVEMILNNRRLVNYYTACMLNKGPCPPEGLELKRILPDALKTNCKRCTDKQKATTLRTVKRLMKEYPKIWAQLKAEWDPEDKYVKLFITTYSNWASIPEPETPMIIFDRFGDEYTSEPSKANETIQESSSQPTSSTTERVWLPPIPPLNPNPGYSPLGNSIGQGLRATIDRFYRVGYHIAVRTIVFVNNFGTGMTESALKYFLRPK
ncbi:uncharacterized protein LOC126889563 isoform X2 [Diabrotica virgifera virgifera]|uniref:Ejaculatory bulb-specific protein 3-like n=1 Tax=Diabrotica virgifera virgifera TaxID=50390 RepID=A0ABM5KUN2_DIAVI|nr:uncharacterized protein LOC126889563 isoform X2 [Diabrotica virgifera virgifera]